MTETQHEAGLLGDWLSWDPASLVPSDRNVLVPLLTWMFARLRPDLCVELGSHDGDTFRALCQIGDRFSPDGRLVAVDPWTPELRRAPLAQSAYEGLTEYCRTAHADRASVVRTDYLTAVSGFEDASIDFLHIASFAHTIDTSSLDVNLWIAKMRPGGAVVISGPDERDMDDSTRKVWQQFSDVFPSSVIRLPRPVGIAQLPSDRGAPLVEFLQAAPDELSSLFRMLGERTLYRHALGSEARSWRGVQKSRTSLTEAHAAELRGIQNRHRVHLEAIEHDLSAVSDRLLERAGEVQELQSEADFLLAQLASRSAAHERELADAARTHDDLTDDLMRRLGDRDTQLQRQGELLADQQAYAQAVTATLSWRATRPLRAVQSRLIRARVVHRH
jgi:hypothetical protein